MENYQILKKSDLNSFIKQLAEGQRIFGPKANGLKNFSFREAKSARDLTLRYLPTILPPKKYFMPQSETLVEFRKSANECKAVLEDEKITIFGVHTCDLAGIQCLDMVFSDEPKDVNYIARKNKISIIGLECNDYCDEYASCAVVDNQLPNGGYDLFFSELEDVFMVQVNTQIGEDMVKMTKLFTAPIPEDYKQFKALREKKRALFKDEVNTNYEGLKPLFDKSFSAKVWNDLDKRCLACGNCTNVCPTCYCFDLVDEINLDLDSGIKCRKWDSCQNEEFAKVAGGENFRAKRGMRQRHRYMRKFNYPFERYSRYFCTGCGRCSRACMAKINLKETINSLIEENK